MILDDGHVELAEGAIVDGRLRIVEELARGSMSSVYLARELDSGRDVVLKILGGKYATRADARPRLLAEEQYTAALAGRPGIVRVLSTGALADEGDAPYLVLEYVDGPTLTGHVAGQSTDVAHVLTLLAELAGIVADVHATGIVHRDIKPENVLVAERDGEVVLKLTDFGLATRATDAGPGSGSTGRDGSSGSPESGLRLTGDHDRPGTHHYMAPEQCVGGDVGTPADIYALGVSAFELLVGEPPWGSRTGREVVIRKCDPTLPCFAISDLSLGLPAMVVVAIDAALQREPALRPTASGFRDAMRAGAIEVRARPGAVLLPPVRVTRGRAHTPKRPMPAAAGGATLMGVPAARSGTASAAATMRLGRGRMELVVPEVTRPSDLELLPVTAPVVVTPEPSSAETPSAETPSAEPAITEPTIAEPSSPAPVARQRRAHPERHVEVTELSPRAGAIMVAAEARARSGDTEAVIAVPSGMTEVIDRAAVEQAIARASAAAKLGEPLGPAIEVERETYAEHDAARGAKIAASSTLDRRAGGRRGLRWVALLGVLSVGAAVVLWWVDDTVRAGEGRRDDLGGAETRPAAIASDEPGLVGAAPDVGGPRVAAVEVKPEVMPPTEALHPVPAPSVEDTSADAPSKPPTKPITPARPRPAKPDAPDPVPSTPVAAVPIHETAACVEARAAVARAASSAAWADVLAHSKNRRCWSDASVVTRARVRALATLGRYDECVREGKGVTDPALAALIEVCRTRRGEP
jgi:eukaryotic-like serine/threonine-protein kinase